MATAVESLNRQLGRLEDPSISNNNLDIDVSEFLLDVVNSKKYDIDVAGSIVDGNIIRTMDGASTVDITVEDHNRKILRSGLFGNGDDDFPAIDVNFDGLWMRLIEVNKQGDQLVLTFEDRIVAYLRAHQKPRKVSRREMTRAQFIHSMVKEVKATPINFFSPAESIKQPIASIDTNTNTRRSKKKPGFHLSSKLKLKETDANKKQIEVGAKILAIGSDMGANDKVLTTAIAVSMTESQLNPNIGEDFAHSGHFGAFQQDTSKGSIWRSLGGGTGNLEADTKAFYTMAIKKDKKYPNVTIGWLGELTQYPGETYPNLVTVYHTTVQGYVASAKEWVKQYNGGGGGSEPITRRMQYYFMRGQPDGPKGENSWDASGRLADEVNWRRFVVGNTFFYVRDADLMKQIASDHLSEKDAEVDYIDFDMDRGKPVQEATVTCRAVRWLAHPGEVIVLEDCGPANGRWLVQQIDKKLFDPSATITLRKPHGSKKEPAPGTTTESRTTGGKAGTKGDVTIAATADRPGVPTHKAVIAFVEYMAGVLGKKIVITTGSNHSRLTTSGTVSDHWNGNAADLGSVANHFAVGGKGGDDIARAAATVLGLKLKDVTGNWFWHTWEWQNRPYKVQVGWKEPDGSHYDHVHIGVEFIGKGGAQPGPFINNTSGH